MSRLLRPRFPRTMLTMMAATWLWRRRHELAGWASFLRDVPERLRRGERQDVISEARLRMKLSRDPATRGIGGLTVRDGVAHLQARDEDVPLAVAGMHAKAVGLDEVTIAAPETLTVLGDERARVV